MTYYFRHLVFAVLIFTASVLASGTAKAAISQPVDSGKVVASLISTHDFAAPGEDIYIALRTVMDDHWHTYWRNPGDSGEKVHIEWDLPADMVAKGMSAGEIIWPLPHTIATGPIVNYGFEGEPIFPVAFTVPEDAAPGDVLTIKADAYYLVCKELCIPEDAQLELTLTVGTSVKDELWNSVIQTALDDAPKAMPSVRASIAQLEDNVIMSFIDLPDGNFDDAFFFSYQTGVILPAAPQTLKHGDKGFHLTTKADYLWETSINIPALGVLKYKTTSGEETGIIVSANNDRPFDIGKTVKATSSTTATGGFTLIGAMISAFIGGLILNLMPCVFPVISIKALSLVGAAHSDRMHARREGWFYTFGVLATFLLLTIILLAVKAAGANFGWGFQLQSPIMVGALAILLFIIGLNLLGMFEFNIGGVQNTGSELTQKGGMAGAFFTGALAVIVATPCTAPFMAGAIGYALAQPAAVTLAVFMALAVGFAAPFLLLAYTPRLLARLPKPGPWMVHFREFLAFPMFAAAIWLVSVVALQSGFDGAALILIAMLAIAFGLWCFKRNHIIWKVLGGLLILGALASPFTLKVNTDAGTTAAHLETQAWSPENIRMARAEGRPVFVDFTAAWCVSCKVNEKLVLNTKGVKDLFEETNTAVLIGDWTNKNDEIANELARHGRSGVPLYLVYPAGTDDVEPQILPQILSPSILRKALSTN